MKCLFAISILLMSLVSCQSNKQFSEKMKEKIVQDVNRDDITGRMHMLFRSIDNQNWEDVLKVLAPEVEMDMGDGVKKITAEQVVNLWKENAKELQGLQHQVSNYGIEVKERNAKLNFVGTTTYYKVVRKKPSVKRMYGSYEVHMLQPEGDETNWEWKVTRFAYKNRFTTND